MSWGPLFTAFSRSITFLIVLAKHVIEVTESMVVGMCGWDSPHLDGSGNRDRTGNRDPFSIRLVVQGSTAFPDITMWRPNIQIQEPGKDISHSSFTSLKRKLDLYRKSGSFGQSPPWPVSLQISEEGIQPRPTPGLLLVQQSTSTEVTFIWEILSSQSPELMRLVGLLDRLLGSLSVSSPAPVLPAKAFPVTVKYQPFLPPVTFRTVSGFPPC